MIESNYSVVEELVSQQESLRKQIISALDNAPAFSNHSRLREIFSPWPVNKMPTFTLSREGIIFPIYSSPARPNDVYLSAKESHLYPWLCREVYDIVDIRGRTEQETALHELSHFAAALASQKIEPRIGFSFYKDSKRGKKVFVEANVLMEGEGSVEEIRAIISAPGNDMSKQDRAILREFNQYVAKNSLNTWPVWPISSKYSSQRS